MNGERCWGFLFLRIYSHLIGIRLVENIPASGSFILVKVYHIAAIVACKPDLNDHITSNIDSAILAIESFDDLTTPTGSSLVVWRNLGIIAPDYCRVPEVPATSHVLSGKGIPRGDQF